VLFAGDRFLEKSGVSEKFLSRDYVIIVTIIVKRLLIPITVTFSIFMFLYLIVQVLYYWINE